MLVAIVVLAACKGGLFPPSSDQPRPIASQQPASEPPVQQPPPAKPRVIFEDGVPVIPVDHWLWCYTVTGDGPPIDMCESEQEACMFMSKRMGRGCAPTDRMSCFTTRSNQGQDMAVCFRTVAVCRDAMINWSSPITRGCVGFRYVP